MDRRFLEALLRGSSIIKRGFPQLYVTFRRGPDQMDITIFPILIQDESIHQYHGTQYKINTPYQKNK